MNPSRSHRLIYFINDGDIIQIVTFFSCDIIYRFKFLINTREKQELSGVESGTYRFYSL